MDTARVLQVIETTLLRRGKGVEGDPVRCITQYWSMDGELLAEVDPVMTAEEIRQEEQVAGAVSRMRAWAAEHPEADTQGLMDDEWEALAREALEAGER